ncbi:MAG: hypothetical protein AAF307_13580, partial [Pseudomonadota bacterium]
VCATFVTAASAQQTTIAGPALGMANYDPTMSAREAVLANWELAVSGIRAGRVLGENVVELADKDVPFAVLARQATFAQKTMVQRYNAAQWVYTDGSGVVAYPVGNALAAAVASTGLVCDAPPCPQERAALKNAFKAATLALEEASVSARGALTAREDLPDQVLMTEQLTLLADFLERGDWAEGFALTAFNRDAEELAARMVGAMSLWRNVEPYVGTASPEIDDAINVAAQQLLRTLRQTTRGAGALAPNGPELTAITEKAGSLAQEFRRAAGLFAT